MRVLHLSTARTWRGGEQQLAYLYGELQGHGVQQQIVCAGYSSMHEWCRENNIDHVTFDRGSPMRPDSARAIAGFCRSFRADLAHAHDAHAHTILFMSTVLARHKTPIVVSRRVDFPVKNSFVARLKYNSRRIRAYLCVSNAIREVLTAGVSDTSRLYTVHSGVDPRRFGLAASGILRREFDIPASIPLIGNSSALADHKDYPTFLRVARRLIDSGLSARFFIIGEGPERPIIESLISQLGLQDQVVMAGFRYDVPEILPELDLFLVTSKTEGLGTSLLDAMVCRVPIVATRAGGIPEIVVDRESGLLADVGDVEMLLGMVKRVLGDKELRDRLVRNAAERVKQFTCAETARKTLAIYRAVIGVDAK